MNKKWKRPVIVTISEFDLGSIIAPMACSGRYEWV